MRIMLGTLDAVSVSGYRAACALLRILRRGDDVGIARPQPPPRHATKAPEGLWSSNRDDIHDGFYEVSFTRHPRRGDRRWAGAGFLRTAKVPYGLEPHIPGNFSISPMVFCARDTVPAAAAAVIRFESW